MVVASANISQVLQKTNKQVGGSCIEEATWKMWKTQSFLFHYTW